MKMSHIKQLGLVLLVTLMCYKMLYFLVNDDTVKSINYLATIATKVIKERPCETNISHDRLSRLPCRESNHTVPISIKEDEIPDWISCPSAVISNYFWLLTKSNLASIAKVTSQSIWSMAVTENEVLYNTVSAMSIKVN